MPKPPPERKPPTRQSLRLSRRRPAKVFKGPIHTLPVDLLLTIFDVLLETQKVDNGASRQLACQDPLTPWPCPHRTRQLALLAAVCRAWRNVIHQHSSLWEDLEVEPNTSPSFVRRALACSRARPLSISLFFLTDTRPRSDPDYTVISMSPHDQYQKLRTILRLLDSSRSRWQSLSVYAHERGILHTVLRELHIPGSLPQLTSFKLLCTSETPLPPYPQVQEWTPFPPLLVHSSPQDHADDPHPLARTLSSLDLSFRCRDLRLRGCRMDWSIFKDILGSSLHALCLDNIIDTIPIPVLADILKQAPKLEALRIAGPFAEVCVDSEASSTSPHALPNVVDLALSDFEPSQALQLFQTLQLPSVRSLSIEMAYASHTSTVNGCAPLISLMASGINGLTWSKLHRLSLRGLPVPSRCTHLVEVPFFAHLSSLSEIYLDFLYLQIEYWEGFLKATSQGALTSLHCLTVRGLSPLSVQEYICLRIELGLPKIHVTISITPEFDTLDTIHLSRWGGWLRCNTSSCTIL